MAELMTATHARWQVLWVAVKKGKRPKIVEVDFEDDLAGARDLLLRAKQAKKPFATLRCCNVGFPPPEKYRPYYEMVKVPTNNTKVVRRNGKRKRVRIIKTEEVYREPMSTANLKGIWWCPYCMEMRRFALQSAFVIEGIRVGEPGMHCPICGVSHRDHHVRKWNPQAQRIPFKLKATRTRRSNAASSRRRRTRRR